jgi:putative membrane protein
MGFAMLLAVGLQGVFMLGYHRSTTVGSLFRGSVAGMIGGAAGAWVMNNFHENARAKPSASAHASAGSASATHKRTAQHHNGGEQPTVQVAEAVSRRVFGHELGDTEKTIAGPAVHFGYGILVGGLYGALAEVWPNVKIGMGMGYGIALWAVGHEAALPMLKLAPSPLEEPAREHADQLSAHICYGMTLDCVRRMAKWFL